MFKRVTRKLTNNYYTTVGLPVSLRTVKGEKQYAHAKAAPDTLKPLITETKLREWNHWAIIENAFPYDAIFKTHHLLIPKREVAHKDLNDSEHSELSKILKELSGDYDCHLTNFPKKQSILNHFHIHLLIYKDHRAEVAF